MFELGSLFWSILGAPASGKSYFLASMTWSLRKTLPKHFALSFSDADPTANRSLNEYEELQFLNPNPEDLVAIRKTELQGELYDTVAFGDQTVSYPRPYLFAVRPLQHHPNASQLNRIGRVVCLYDNAGEHFLPGQDTVSTPVTRHMAQSRVLFYLFDPTQDPRFRQACAGKSNDPQVKDHARTSRQETVLHEAASRIRRFSGLPHDAKHDRPLIVIVTKFDTWAHLLPNFELRLPWAWGKSGESCAIDLAYVEHVSSKVRSLLWHYSPEVVSAAEDFAQEVHYLPVSATGVSPEVDARTGMLGIRPRDIRPIWSEVPLIYALARWMNGLVPYLQRNERGANGDSPVASPGSEAPSPTMWPPGENPTR